MLLISVLLYGCDFLIGPNKPVENGNLTIRMAGDTSAKSVSPAEADSYRYALTFTGPGGQSLTREVAPGGEILNLSLALGEWTIEARAYSGDIPAGRGKKTITILPGPNSATIHMDETFILDVGIDGNVPFTFPSASIDYAPDSYIVTVSNQGVHDTGPLTVTLSGDDPGSFTLGTASLSGILIDDSDSFTIEPVSDLAPGTYTAAIIVRSDNGFNEERFEISFAVKPVYTTIAGISVYLTDSGTVGTDLAPALLPVSLDLADTTNGWTKLLEAIGSAGKYVALDLSESTPANIEFDPGTADTGKDHIVKLTLPDGAESIKDGSESNSTFGNFSGLKEVSGANIEHIGEYAFNNCTALEMVSFPKATDIGDEAFGDCTALKTASFPAVESIGVAAVAGCTTLQTVSFPVAETIGDYAFQNCAALETASFPKAETIGDWAFTGCTTLQAASFPKATSISDWAFQDCAALQTVSFPKAETIGDYAFESCTALQTADFPAATAIGDYAFRFTGAADLTITLGTAPSLGSTIFLDDATNNKSVTVITNGAAGYDGGSDGTWGNAFRAGSSIDLTIVP